MLKAVLKLQNLRFQFHSGSIKREQFSSFHIKETVFQFHSGSIKSFHKEQDDEKDFEFQFHSGSIKSIHLVSLLVWQEQFQFHSGSIKRCLLLIVSSFPFGFNSIVVRLKGQEENVKNRSPDRFQFHSGSIKSMPHHTPNELIKLSFNSIVVRLKELWNTHRRTQLPRFNSIVVRLKGKMNIRLGDAYDVSIP